MTDSKKYKIAFLVSHPIQYFSPLFREMSNHPQIDLTVYYCSDESIKGMYDIEFVTQVKWDIPLLDGYKYKFLKNYSIKPSIFNGFLGLINVGIINEIRKGKYDGVIVHGWNYFTHILTLVFARFFTQKLMLRGENPLSHELAKPFWKIWIKKLVLRWGLFRLVNCFLFVGQGNKDFYRYYGVPIEKMFFTPYAVDNDRFHDLYLQLKEKRQQRREQLNLPLDKVIILFVGKLIVKKRPLDLLYAYAKIKTQKKFLVLVGDGSLREKLEHEMLSLTDIVITGFKNQSELPDYYATADILVLPSGAGETWGLVVNEAMNFGVPIVVSDMVGCAGELIEHGKNGFVFRTGNTEELAIYIETLVEDDELRKCMRKCAFDKIKNYSYNIVIDGILNAMSNGHERGEKLL